MSRQTSHSGWWITWCWEISRPAVKRMESPGRKKPMRSPDSAKTIRSTPMSPKVETRWLASNMGQRASRFLGGRRT